MEAGRSLVISREPPEKVRRIARPELTSSVLTTGRSSRRQRYIKIRSMCLELDLDNCCLDSYHQPMAYLSSDEGANSTHTIAVRGYAT